ncbi:MAG: hypothetical protein IPH58_06615 [Sphingobacteriales bacterium]|jgi:hypothetical protein|nr:hypothetical protein [Sphingobacteriales bacterium]
MKRKRWTPQGEATPELLKVREKRRWQISLRRYVLEENLSLAYAPYFGLDIKNMRLWFEFQFNDGLNWANFGEKWQFDHIIPVTYFDFSNEEELKMCWNFTNLRVEYIKHGKDRGKRLDLIHAREYFREMYETTGFEICLKLLQKIDSIRLSEAINTKTQTDFILQKKDFLNKIGKYKQFEFELLNSGRSVEEVVREIDLLKKHL